MKRTTSKFLLGLLSVTFLTSSVFAAESGRGKKRKATDSLSIQPTLKRRRTRQTVKLQDDFFAACEFGDLETVQRLLEKVDVNQCKEFDSGSTVSPLYVACLNGHEGIVKTLVENHLIQDISIGLLDNSIKKRVPPFYVACLKGHEEVVKILLKSNLIQDANVGFFYDDVAVKTPLYAACLNENKNIVKLLLKREDIEIRRVNKALVNNQLADTTAYSAANDEIKELIKQYIAQEDKICSVCIEDFKDSQALHFSACCQRAIHLHCALGVSNSGNNKCVHCNGIATGLNSFLYKGVTSYDASTQTENEQ